MDRVEFVLENDDAFSELRFLITGFYGLGFCGYLTTRFLYDAARGSGKAERLAIVWSNAMPPVVEVDETGKFRYPMEVYKIDGKSAVLLFRYQPAMSVQVGIADSLTKLASSKKLTLILCGGIDVNALPERDKEKADVVYVCNRLFESEYIEGGSWDVPRSPPEVVVSGGIALILMYAERRGVPAVSLLTPTYAKTGYLDYQASLKLARRIVGLFDLDVELSVVEEKVQEIESQRILRIMEERRARKKFEETEELEEFGIT